MKLTTTEILELVKISLAVVAGIGGVVALVVAYRKQRIAEASESREQTKLFNERFLGASGQLGDESPAVRLAGVHALAALADDWEGGRQMCIDVLCAYLRLPSEPEPNLTGEPAEHAAWRAMGEVRATIWRLIAAHLNRYAPIPWHGADLDFTAVSITGDLDFTDAVFPIGRLRFDNAVFASGRVSFLNTQVSGSTLSFKGAQITGAHIEFNDAKFDDGLIHFDHMVIDGGKLAFDGASFTNGLTRFTSTNVRSGAISFADALFQGGRFEWLDGELTGGSLSFDHSSLTQGTLSFRAQFCGINATFKGTRFVGGAVAFEGEFASGEVAFDQAMFAGSRAEFDAAKFTGGLVTFRNIKNWSHPPTGLPDTTPGLTLSAPDAALPESQ